ncbi:MAG: glucosidase, partial [Planctomycetota bacterium]
MSNTAEHQRLAADARRDANWKRWGTYLAERQWGTVREDYSTYGDCWNYFPHDQARSRAYRWGEDGLLGITDRECRLCFALAPWNGRDAILKERLYGLTNGEGNHGEDVKELYYYLDATPTHSYCRGLYKYPQAPFPYADLRDVNSGRGKLAPEYELLDTDALAGGHWDVTAEYAKGSPNDICIRITVANHGPSAATLHLLPTLWFRNGWSWGATHEGMFAKPMMALDDGVVCAEHETLNAFEFTATEPPGDWLFCDNETNGERLWGNAGAKHPKDAFHRHVIDGETGVVNPDRVGTKCAAWYELELGASATKTLTFRLTDVDEKGGPPIEQVFADRIAEADAFYATVIPEDLSDERQRIARQAYAGLLWTKQFYFYSVNHWLRGDPAQPGPPPQRKPNARNRDWRDHLFNRDVLSMPDKWEYPWYAAWDTAFHMLPMCKVDPKFAKDQLVLFLREWYMHPNGQIPAYEFNFSDVNPPVHAWAVWRVYKMTAPRGQRDRAFLERCFHKLLLNFTWWVTRKDEDDNHLFGGGFLGLDNIGLFDRSAEQFHDGRQLEQADGTAWMAFYCVTMLSIALELADDDPVYEDVASKFFEHFVAITHAMNTIGGSGLWDDTDGFYYDQLWDPGTQTSDPLRIRSFVGLIPTFACEILTQERLDKLPGFAKRVKWFRQNRPRLNQHITQRTMPDGKDALLLSVVGPDKLEKVLRYALSEDEFLSPFGMRSLSKHHEQHPYVYHAACNEYRVKYTPAESTTDMFGGNSNWRGPIWFPLNYLFIEALERYH